MIAGALVLRKLLTLAFYGRCISWREKGSFFVGIYQGFRGERLKEKATGFDYCMTRTIHEGYVFSIAGHKQEQEFPSGYRVLPNYRTR